MLLSAESPVEGGFFPPVHLLPVIVVKESHILRLPLGQVMILVGDDGSVLPQDTPLLVFIHDKEKLFGARTLFRS